MKYTIYSVDIINQHDVVFILSCDNIFHEIVFEIREFYALNKSEKLELISSALKDKLAAAQDLYTLIGREIYIPNLYRKAYGES